MKKVAVLGAGKMGAGIAQVAAQGGYNVVLRDLQTSLVKDGLRLIEKNLDKAIKAQLMEAPGKEEILRRIEGTTDLTNVRDADLVIESVVENMAVKKQLFAELDNICAPHAILATNTSSLSINEIASATQRTDRVMGMHFHNPVPYIKLVELIRGLETSEATLADAQEFTRQIDKVFVVAQRESPGFIFNRVLIPYLNEAIFVLSEGIADRDGIDNALKLGAGMPLGPLEMADLMGLDILYSVTVAFYEEFRDPKYRPPVYLSTMVRAGHLGKKSGKGFYDYENGKKVNSSGNNANT
ncbi:MAG TPA: 3-hydroxyacyl-CoA dehydrogenase NAD-binding domain-containing protein [Syntrophomonadaceae bacterium]|nr:3-hydroxyacyl-CoA dehydrogenase NAD-binding domain-containing protein [Syntrophomonadaceae bacterium]